MHRNGNYAALEKYLVVLLIKKLRNLVDLDIMLDNKEPWQNVHKTIRSILSNFSVKFPTLSYQPSNDISLVHSNIIA